MAFDLSPCDLEHIRGLEPRLATVVKQAATIAAIPFSVYRAADPHVVDLLPAPYDGVDVEPFVTLEHTVLAAAAIHKTAIRPRDPSRPRNPRFELHL